MARASLDSAAAPAAETSKPTPGWLLLLVIGLPLLAAVVIVVWALGPIVMGHFRTEDTLAHGTPAQARILDLTDTGNRINDQPVIAITLDVMPSGQPEYTATVRRVITIADAEYFSRGNVISVKFDPEHPDRVAIVTSP